jgi:hypothetical protein
MDGFPALLEDEWKNTRLSSFRFIGRKRKLGSAISDGLCPDELLLTADSRPQYRIVGYHTVTYVLFWADKPLCFKFPQKVPSEGGWRSAF